MQFYVDDELIYSPVDKPFLMTIYKQHKFLKNLDGNRLAIYGAYYSTRSGFCQYPI